jgi:DNA-binding beta-propeller fold protein YncE
MKTKMKTFKQVLLVTSIGIAATGCSDNGSKDQPTALEALGITCETIETAATTAVDGTASLALVGSYVSANIFDSSSAEIVSYDSCSDKIYVVNAQQETVDILSFDNSSLIKSATIDLTAAASQAGIDIGAANSVSAKQGLVAVAIEAARKQDDGIIALYRSDDLSLINTYPAGALPDMVALSDDGLLLLAANEGEPSGDYSNDPEGSVTLVDIASGFSDDDVLITQISFADFNNGGPRASELDASVRLGGPASSSVAQNIEPEYLTIDSLNSKAYVALQENNAMAIIDLETAEVESIKSLGFKAWDSASGNQLDASNKDGIVGNFASYEQLVGLYMPDTITSYSVDGEIYIVSANEGDGREYIYESTQQTCDTAGHSWAGDDFFGTSDYSVELDDCISFTDEARGDDLTVADGHPLQADLQDDDILGRIKVIFDSSTIAANEVVKTFGARSFSIWNGDIELQFDSGDQLAKDIFNQSPAAFNATNDNNDVGETSDNRSDDKGVEPEAIEVALIGERHYAFIGMERQGGVAIYDVTDPQAPVYQSYLNNRDFSQDVCTAVDDGNCDNGTYNPAAGDLGPESIDYFSRAAKHYIVVGNEVSGTSTVYQVVID